MADKQRPVVPPTEVQPKAKRRAFSAEFERRILVVPRALYVAVLATMAAIMFLVVRLGAEHR